MMAEHDKWGSARWPLGTSERVRKWLVASNAATKWLMMTKLCWVFCVRLKGIRNGKHGEHEQIVRVSFWKIFLVSYYFQSNTMKQETKQNKNENLKIEHFRSENLFFPFVESLQRFFLFHFTRTRSPENDKFLMWIKMDSR